VSKAICWVFVIGSLVAPGCGGIKPSVTADNERLQAQVAQMRARSRADRNRIRDLRNEVTVLRDDDNPAPAATRLPVQVVEPPPEIEHHHEDTATPPDNEPITLGGYDEDGAEIVYVGEAAVGPSIELSPERYDLRASRQTSTKRTRPSPKTLPEVPSAKEHLGVTDGSLPVVSRVDSSPPPAVRPSADTQLRQGRAQGPRARKRSFEDPTVEYQRYYAALRAGRHAEAVSGFRNFVKRFPDHGHADNAQYWLGEAFYDQRQFRSAAVEFKKVIDGFPTGNKVPDAMLKLGYCHAHLGETTAAKNALNRVIDEYPSSNPATLAARKLEQL